MELERNVHFSLLSEQHADLVKYHVVCCCRFLYSELKHVVQGGTSQVLAAAPDGKYDIKDGIHFHMFITQAPCEFGPNLVNIDPFVRARNRVRRQSRFPTFISCQRQDANVLPKRRQSHQGDKLCDVSTVPLVARWPVFLACGSDVDGEPH